MDKEKQITAGEKKRRRMPKLNLKDCDDDEQIRQ